MKKKIINGILMVALMFATTSSFVSCKDNVDDDFADVYAQLSSKKAELEAKLADLQNQIANIQPIIQNITNEYVTEEITKVEEKIYDVSEEVKQEIYNNYDPKIEALNQSIEEINNQLAIVNKWIGDFALYKDEIDNALTNIDNRLNTLDEQYKEIIDRLAELEKLIKGISPITKFDIDLAYSPVFGSWNIPMMKANSLAAFYGTNDAGIDKFPQAGYDFEVGGSKFTCYLEANEIGSDVTYFENDYITDAVGNAGKIFFTVLPVDTDLSKYELTIENSNGKANPIKLTNIKKSDAVITYNAGKAAGFVRSGQVAENGLYEADATIAENDLEATRFGVEKFIDLKKIQNQVTEAIEEVRAADGRAHYKEVAKQIVRQAGAIVFDLFNNDLTATDYLNNPSYAPQRLALTQTQDGLKVRKGLTDLELFTTAVMPLSYNTFFEYENAKTDNWIIEVALEKAIARIAKEIKERYNTPLVSAKILSLNEGDQSVNVIVGTKEEKINISNDEQWSNLKKAISANGGLDNVNSMISDILKEVSLGKAAQRSAERINAYLDKTSNYIVNLINKHAFTRAVAPIIIFETSNGVDRLAEGMFIKPGVMHAYLTSATYELLVPAYKKYVAVVTEDGKLVQSALLPGNTLSYDIALSEPGDYKVILSCVDYFGYVVTKKYNVHVL